MKQYCLYLRKSRSDQEAEARGEGETLARHEKALLELAKRQHLNITSIYREVVSGETIAARPIMQQLLREVEAGMWTGVLVMEVERLARGDTIDQGIMAQTFKFSDTLIITPIKTYDPNNEFDEEYFEFGLFMSRREYKTINRRMQRGRAAAANEGRFVGNRPPYGYQKVKIPNDKGFTLEPIEEEAQVIRLIFNSYAGTNGNQLGPSKIVNMLNSLGIQPPRSNTWAESTIRDILQNPVYIGKIRWSNRAQVKKSVNGSIIKTRPRNKNHQIASGLHQAIVDEELFKLVQDKFSNYPSAPLNRNSTVQNPLAGLVVCAKCGHKMVRKPYKNNNPPSLLCTNPSCDNVSSLLEVVERKVIDSLKQWVDQYKLAASLPLKPINELILMKETQYSELLKETNKTQAQIDKTYDLLEQNIYTTEMFLDRIKKLSDKISELTKSSKSLRESIEKEKLRYNQQSQLVPKVESLTLLYETLQDPATKNNLLKEVLEKVVYLKTKRCFKNDDLDNFEIDIYPRVSPFDK